MAILVTDTERQVHKIPTVKEVGARIEKRISEYALPLGTRYGADLYLTMDSQTYVVTACLKDQNGDYLGTAKTIDLPLESVVVSGSYDATTKKVILTLQNGSTVAFSVADLVEGLVPDTRKIAGVDLKDDISKSEMQQALNIEDGAQKNTVLSVAGLTGNISAQALLNALGLQFEDVEI